jgi:hypothetical protein
MEDLSFSTSVIFQQETQRLRDLDELKQNDEDVFLYNNRTIERFEVKHKENVLYWGKTFILTDRTLYGRCAENELYCVLYVFTDRISKQTAPQLWFKGGLVPFYEMSYSLFEHEWNQVNKNAVESYTRLIPGSYQYKTWRQIGGFFGCYINMETKEVLSHPPWM